MQYRQLGCSGVSVSEISLGCWTMGGPSWTDGEPTGWPPADEDDVTAAIKTAIDAGVNHFDTADCYGNGESERMLARVFRRLGVPSTNYIIATKLGYVRGSAAHPYEPAHVRRQCEQSLINLKRDYIDLYYFHHANFGAQDEYLAPALAAMNDLVREGKVRIVGQSAYSDADFERTVPAVRPAVLQSWGNLLDDRFIRPGTTVSRLLEERGAGFVAFSPLAHGLLMGKYRAGHPPNFGPGDHRAANANFSMDNIATLSAKITALKALFGKTDADLAAVAQRFVLCHPGVACVITGFRNSAQVACNLGVAKRQLHQDEVEALRALFADLSFS